MSAVSSESPLAAADLSVPSTTPSSSGNGLQAEPADHGAPPANADFGPNEWLVDELYQRYLADPGSVDRAWWSFFADYKPVRATEQAAGPVAAPAPPQPSPTRPPAPRRGAAPLTRLRGAAARTAQNMAASLSVPTATSVRAVPAKLLIDNRIVINNHLQRGKGGKVSFTHLIGYAVVAALKALPEMNDAYTEENGKPAIARPEHVNLGLAIDVQAADGARQLLV